MQDSNTQRSWNDLWSGAIFVVIASAFGVTSMRYDFGSGALMGPAFFPALLAFLLLSLGALTIAKGILRPELSIRTPTPWRPILLICVSLALFAEFSESMGLLPVVFACTALTALSSTRNNPVSALIMATIMSTLCYLIFKLGLGINLPTFGPLFGI